MWFLIKMRSQTFLTLILLTIALSVAQINTYKVNEEMNITVVCLNQGYCSNTSYCNINVGRQVDANLIIQGQNMTMTDTFFYYNFTPQTIGIYNVGGICVDGSDYEEIDFSFEVTKNGYQISFGESILYTILFVMILLLFGFFLFITVITPFSNDTVKTDSVISIVKVTGYKYLKLMSAVITYGLYLMILMFLTGFTQNYVNFPEMKSLMTNIWTFSYYLGFGLIFSVMMVIFVLLWKDIVFNKIIIQNGQYVLRELER